METVALALVIATAASICPAMMWWERRRWHDAACCAPVPRADAAAGGEDPDLEMLRSRRDDLAARRAELDGSPRKGLRPAAPTAR